MSARITERQRSRKKRHGCKGVEGENESRKVTAREYGEGRRTRHEKCRKREDCEGGVVSLSRCRGKVAGKE
jgi:hypothetical protein